MTQMNDERSGIGQRDGNLVPDPEPFTHEQDNPRTHENQDDRLRVDVVEEELVASKRQVDRGDVRIHKDVVSEEQQIDVPVTEERVEVTRVAVDREAVPDETAFQEGTIEVPVYGEEVEVEKRARVAEELQIDKEVVQETQRVSDTVRREEVTVEGEVVDQAQTTSGSGRNSKKKRR